MNLQVRTLQSPSPAKLQRTSRLGKQFLNPKEEVTIETIPAKKKKKKWEVN